LGRRQEAQHPTARASPNLVDHSAIRKAGKEAPRVGLRLLALVRIFQGHVGTISEQGAGERRLTGLTRTCDGEDGESPRQAKRGLFGITADHTVALTN